METKPPKRTCPHLHAAIIPATKGGGNVHSLHREDRIRSPTLVPGTTGTLIHTHPYNHAHTNTNNHTSYLTTTLANKYPTTSALTHQYSHPSAPTLTPPIHPPSCLALGKTEHKPAPPFAEKMPRVSFRMADGFINSISPSCCVLCCFNLSSRGKWELEGEMGDWPIEGACFVFFYSAPF